MGRAPGRAGRRRGSRPFFLPPVYNARMPLVTFDQLPDNARLWIYAADRRLDPAEGAELLGALDGFLAEWKAHGEPLTVGRDWRYDQFLFVAVDESAAGASGCSIDALVHTLGQLEQRLGITLLDHGPVLFRYGNRIERLPRPEFAELARRGGISADTVVFNNTLTRVGDVGAGRWETPARDSWHARAFGLAEHARA